jgi:hemerythrin-like domain-containing protein
MNSIAKIMLMDHGKINDLLNKAIALCETNIQNSFEQFQVFTQKIENHLLIEDKAIFVLFEKFSSRDTGTIFELMQEHTQIDGLIKNILEQYEKHQKPSFTELKNLLEKHSEIEAKYFYENLEKKLTDNQKADILLKIDQAKI